MTVTAINTNKNLVSEEVVVKVKRTGPNQPKVEGIYNNSDLITGNLNDTDANVLAIVDDQVYVGNEKTAELFKKCPTIYNEEYTIHVTDVRVDSANYYQLTVPVQKIGTQINVYTVDHISRSSMVNSVKVKDAAPNPPELYEITSADNQLEGVITSSKANTVFTVYLTVKNESYVVKTDKSGYFCVEVDPSLLKVGTEISVQAKDMVKNINRTSYTTVTTVKDPEEFISDVTELSLSDVEVGQTTISGYTDDDEVTIAVKSHGSYQVYRVQPDRDGDFSFDLNTPLKSGDIIYAHTTAPNGAIMDMVKEQVANVAPSKPVIDGAVTNATTTFVVYTDVEASVVATIGKEKYECKESFYNDLEEMYQFNVEIPQTASGKKIKVYAYNEAGKSKAVTVTVKKYVPDEPKVDPIYTTTKTIKGKIDVAANTKIFAKIGKKTYSGKVKSNGAFSIKIPKQKKNTKVTVWASNSVGKGLTVSTKVTMKTK